MRTRIATLVVIALLPFLFATAAVAAMPTCVDYDAYMHRIGNLSLGWENKQPMRVIVDGDHLYFNDINSQACVVDISDPRNPQLLPGRMGLHYPATEFGYAAGHVYLGDADGLTVFDVTDPSAPSKAAFLPLPSQVVGVAVRGSRAYVSRHSEEQPVGPLDVIDISDPAAPRVVTTVDGLGGMVTCFAGDRLYSAWMAINVIDIANPDAPTLVGSWDPEAIGFAAADFQVVGGMGYFACYSGDLVIADVTDDAAPAVVGTWSSGITRCQAVAVDGGLALVGGEEGQLFAIDITDPAAPVALGAPLMVGDVEDIAISGALAYLGSVSWAQLPIVDIEPARTYSDIAWVDAGAAVVDACATADPDVCLLVVGEELQVLDHGNPDAASVVATRPLPGMPLRVVAAGSRAVVACAEGGLFAFDITDPRAPVALGAVAGVAEAVDLETRDGLVFATGFGGPLWVVDARSAGLPQLVSATSAAIPAYSLAVDGNTVILGADEALQSLDVSDPAAPTSRWVAASPWAGFELELAARDGLIYSSHPGSFRILTDNGTGYDVLNKVLFGTLALCLDGATAYAVGDAGAEIFDLGDPVHPTMAGSIQYTGTDYLHGSCAAVSGDHVIVGYDNGRLAIAPRRCDTTVPVEVASFMAARDGEGVRLRWVVPGAAASEQFRVVVRSTGGDRVLPGAATGDGVFEARDLSAAGPADAVTYVLERRDDRGAWRAIATTTYAPVAVTPATRLTGCAPNPFNPNTRVAFTLAASGRVVVAVHDAAGRQVAVLADATFGAGPHALTWNGRDDMGREAASGVYLVSLRTDAGVDSRKVVLVR